MSENSLQRFYKAQEDNYQRALNELKAGKKSSHWMWFIFPQLVGLGLSETSRYYAISNIEEARLYLQDPILRDRLKTLCTILTELKDKTAYEIFGSPDDLKLQSSMTLFSLVNEAPLIFKKVLDLYFDGKADDKTIQLLDIQIT